MSNATDNLQAPRCNICEIEMTPNNRVLPTLDCGGTCLKCMAENGDEGCADAMKKISFMGADTQAGVLRVGCVSSEMITTDNLGLHVEAGSFVPPPFELVFQLDGKPLGVMKFNDDGAMTFEGEAEPAAQIFLDHIVIKHSEQWQAAQKRIVELETSHTELREALAGIFNTVLMTTTPPPIQAVTVPGERAAFNAWNNEDNLPIAGVGAKNAAWLAWQARAKLMTQPAVVPDERITFSENGGCVIYTDYDAGWNACRTAMLAGN